MTHRDFPNIKFHRAGHMVHIARAMIASILKRTIFSLRLIFDISSAFFHTVRSFFAWVVSSPIAFPRSFLRLSHFPNIYYSICPLLYCIRFIDANFLFCLRFFFILFYPCFSISVAFTVVLWMFASTLYRSDAPNRRNLLLNMIFVVHAVSIPQQNVANQLYNIHDENMVKF